MDRPYHCFALLALETLVLSTWTTRRAGFENTRHVHREWPFLFALPFAACLLAVGLLAAGLLAGCVFVFIPLSHPLLRPQHLIQLDARHSIKHACRAAVASLGWSGCKENDELAARLSPGERNSARVRNDLWRGGPRAASARRCAHGRTRPGRLSFGPRHSLAPRARRWRTPADSRALRFPPAPASPAGRHSFSRRASRSRSPRLAPPKAKKADVAASLARHVA